MSIFEIITANGSRFRFEDEGTLPEYRWEFDLKPGTIDIEDKTIVKVFARVSSVEDDIWEEIAIFSQVIAVGNVDEHTCLIMPPEIRMTRCPRCGYLEKEDQT